jgi:hypothetical protein
MNLSWRDYVLECEAVYHVSDEGIASIFSVVESAKHEAKQRWSLRRVVWQQFTDVSAWLHSSASQKIVLRHVSVCLSVLIKLENR